TLRPLSSPTLFPYTTLFRSFRAVDRPQPPAPAIDHDEQRAADRARLRLGSFTRQKTDRAARLLVQGRHRRHARESVHTSHRAVRSEEHTSELQSLTNLVCRL